MTIDDYKIQVPISPLPYDTEQNYKQTNKKHK